ncbi:hypothetical protein FA15DRAFT_641047 [Coprinopsis marcescibilis]|uniref:DUF2470 domain-containing protein n=1 Tax=Coprinopsis marcescibilis TaxID=230819 RepID=A0A5C3KVB1_COPMA|nr:hypothetical protein FA15DRAFT_641047 [Coprinopsis marcescibilis]
MSTSDPVASKSQFLCMYMLGHPDTLVAYAKWYGKVDEELLTARMTAIDSKSMTLKCTPKARPQDKDSLLVVVPIEPPLSGYEAVKPRLLEMKALAQEGLGMIKVPTINTFRLPFDYPIITCLNAAFINITYIGHLFGYWSGDDTTFTIGSSTSALEWAVVPLRLLRMFAGGPVLMVNFWIVVVIHLLQGLYVGWLCRKHSTGAVVGTLYVISTLFLGLPVWGNLRNRIQQARIDSVMKVQ